MRSFLLRIAYEAMNEDTKPHNSQYPAQQHQNYYHAGHNIFLTLPSHRYSSSRMIPHVALRSSFGRRNLIATQDQDAGGPAPEIEARHPRSNVIESY